MEIGLQRRITIQNDVVIDDHLIDVMFQREPVWFSPYVFFVCSAKIIGKACRSKSESHDSQSIKNKIHSMGVKEGQAE